MIILKVLILLISIYLPGYLLCRLFLSNQKLIKTIALAFGLGLAWITIQLFAIFWIFKLEAGAWFWWLYGLETLVLIFFVWKKKRLKLSPQPVGDFNLREAILIFAIVIQIIFSLFNALSRPIIAADSLSMWSLRAKALFTAQQADFNPASFFYLGGDWHTNYPWHVSLTQYWSAFATNGFSEPMINLLSFLFFLSLLLLLYALIREQTNRLVGLILMFFAASLPLVFYHSYNPYADLPLAYYLLAATGFLFAWLKTERQQYLAWTGIFFGLAFWTKLDALIFILAGLGVILVVAILRKKYKAVLYYLSGLILPNVFWIIFLIKYKLGISNVAGGLGWHPEIFQPLFNSLFVANNWNIWWFIFLAFSLIYIKTIFQQRHLLFGYLFLFLSALGFLCLYLFTEEYQYVVDYTAVGRNLILFVPSSMFLIASLLKYKINKKQIKEDAEKI